MFGAQTVLVVFLDKRISFLCQREESMLRSMKEEPLKVARQQPKALAAVRQLGEEA